MLARIACKRLQIGTNMLLIITSTGDELYKNVNIDDLEWLWTSKISCFSDFFSRFQAVTHILKVNCAEMAGDRPRQSAYEMFSIKRRFYFCKFRVPTLGLRGGGGARERQRRVLLKVVILPPLACVAWKRLQIDADMLFIITSTSDTFLICQRQWPWMTLNSQNRGFRVFFAIFRLRGTQRVLRRNGWQ